MTFVQLAATIVIGAGVLSTVVGLVGIFRMADFYLRMKPFALVTTVGAVGIHVGTSMLTPGAFSYKGLLTAAVFLLTGPALCQALLYAAHRLRVPHVDMRDDLRDAHGTSDDQ